VGRELRDAEGRERARGEGVRAGEVVLRVEHDADRAGVGDVGVERGQAREDREIIATAAVPAHEARPGRGAGDLLAHGALVAPPECEPRAELAQQAQRAGA
jgi:hypothetical protein